MTLSLPKGHRPERKSREKRNPYAMRGPWGKSTRAALRPASGWLVFKTRV